MAFRVQKYCLHKPSGRAYVKIRGVRTYLKKFGSPESRDEYEKLVAKLQRLHEDGGEYRTTLRRLCVDFLNFAATWYRDPDGKPTSELSNYRSAIKTLLRMFDHQPCAEFGPRKLLALREEFAKTHVRSIVNRQIYRVRRIFKWGVSQEMVPADVVVRLQSVEGLQRGRCSAKEFSPVKPVPQEIIAATISHLTGPVVAMVQLQLATGGRPPEIRLMTPGEFDQTGDVWVYRPT